MFGVRLSSLFTSRWMALLWAVLVILTAIQFVGTSDDGADGKRAGQGSNSAPDVVADPQKALIDGAL
ncbi:hypothetical protein [Sphingobium estronivorans]|uniref:hypothetical protein n=1 Tax=Sphingobium estronivorans TaxID=1577690 RepID=UPI00123BDBE4|nr:hypothetical protein [Sphingobium estronivorans]